MGLTVRDDGGLLHEVDSVSVTRDERWDIDRPDTMDVARGSILAYGRRFGSGREVRRIWWGATYLDLIHAWRDVGVLLHVLKMFHSTKNDNRNQHENGSSTPPALKAPSCDTKTEESEVLCMVTD